MFIRSTFLSALRVARSGSLVIRMMSQKPTVVFVLGGPGAGKGTQCSLIVQHYGYVHLSAGDLLREERARKDSEVGQLIEGHIRNGTIVPVEITCSLLEMAMQRNQTEGRHNFLIDGFPRNQDNLDGWNRAMGEKVNLRMVLFFDCDDQVCVQRCLQRGMGGSGRTDDNEESLKKRISTYNQSTKPIIDHYDQQGLVRRLDASKSVAEVFKDVEGYFSGH